MFGAGVYQNIHWRNLKKKCHISKYGCQQGLSDESQDIARWQFCDIRFGHRITGVMISFDYELHNHIQIIFHLAHKWRKCVVSEFSEIMWHKWYFCKLHMIKWKRYRGVSVADTAEILIPLSCSKTSICKHYYEVSHPYNDAGKENRSHDRPLLNTVGMGQDSRISKCWCNEDITVLHLAIGTFQETHASL